jgi:PKD repeat protein
MAESALPVPFNNFGPLPMKTIKKVYWLTCVLMMAIATAAPATTIVMPTDEQLVEKSPLIVRGVVVRSEPVDRNGAIWTETVLQVEQTLKGEAPATMTIREVGGVLENRITKIFGTPEYVAGERVLAFLTPTPRGDYQTVDLFAGKFSETKTVSGLRLWMRSGDVANVTLLDAKFRPIAATNVQRDAAKFEEFVVNRIGGRTAAENYGVENPVMAVPAGGRLQIAPDFTLISEPTVYRWFAFENGASAAWYSYGAQPGYTGGGVSELQTAMSAWTSYTAANIRYSYAGTFSGPPAGNDRSNGVNEVDFNDPTNEISGSWNPSTGGVVGQGGFNGVANSSNWNAPFAADTTHLQQTYRAWNITEGNLVIQDGVASNAGISSKVLGEIIAHELGHTLGFGHSPDTAALMYASVTGRGPVLGADDQVAARWLYPNGSAAPPPAAQAPAAPSNLTASAASSTSATLQWSDHSTNESGFRIYFANGSSGGSFASIGDSAAGSRGATINGLAPGTFRFYVTAFNSSGESSPSNTASLTIASQTTPVSAAFSVSPGTTGTAGSTVFTFTDQSAGSIASRTWNFGDGSTSTSASPAHTYETSGQFTASLTVRDSAGNQSQATRVMTIGSAQQPLTAAFTWSPSSPAAGDAISFSDRSTGGVTSWLWNFGDGSASSDPNPVKIYGQAGSYNVTLTIYRNAESRVASQRISIASKSPATPQPGAFSSLVPVTAQTSGVGGSVWRTELSIFNAGSEMANIDLAFVPSPGVPAQTRSIAVFPRETRTFANALLDIYGISAGAGGISIAATSAASTPDLKITSRTFAATPNGTYGQAVPDVSASDLQNTLYMTGLVSTVDFRTNIGLVNKSSSAVPAALTLLDANGGIVQTASLSVPPNSFQQQSLSGLFPATANGSYPLLSLRIGTGALDAVSVYGSVVDNRTQDPVYVQAMPIAATASTTIPVVARAGGANGTFWRSDVTLFNPNATAANVTLAFQSHSRTITIGTSRTVVIADVVSSFGESAASGPLEISWSGAAVPVVTSRTYTTAANGGTYGQSVGVANAFGAQQYVTGLRSDVDFRTNAGFVNGGDSAITVRATVLSASGAAIGIADLSVAAHSLVQIPLASLVPGFDPASIGSCTLQAVTSNPTLFVYGSVVDNSTGDPVFFAGR